MDKAAILTVLCEILKPERLRTMSPQGLVSAIRYLGQLGWRHEGALGLLFEQVTKHSIFVNLTEEQMSSLALSLANYGLYNDGFVKLLSNVLNDRRRLKKFSTAGLCSTVLFLGAFGEDVEIVKLVITEISRPERLNEMSQADLRRVVEGLRLFDVHGVDFVNDFTFVLKSFTELRNRCARTS